MRPDLLVLGLMSPEQRTAAVSRSQHSIAFVFFQKFLFPIRVLLFQEQKDYLELIILVGGDHPPQPTDSKSTRTWSDNGRLGDRGKWAMSMNQQACDSHGSSQERIQ